MGFGVDTTTPLNQINWSAFKSWKGQYPNFAGRYFGGGYAPGATEFTAAQSETGGALTRIFPICGCEPSLQAATGTTGYNNGVNAANTTIGNVDAARSSNQLKLPASSGARVILYADIEANTSMSVDYWVGWANTIGNQGGELNFVPGLYCPFTQNPANALYYPETSVQSFLNSAESSYPGYFVACYGFIAPSPLYCSYCQPAGTSDFTVFGTYSQPVGGGKSEVVPVLIHQYAEPTACQGCGVSNYAGGQNLDMDGSGNTGAENNMMIIG